MPEFQHIEQQSQIILNPNCPKCGHRMWFAYIDLDTGRPYRRTFKCLECGHSEAVQESD
jgi:transcription elongation factor Elf1